jgi:uncharacterized OsmC-like protein
MPVALLVCWHRPCLCILLPLSMFCPAVCCCVAVDFAFQAERRLQEEVERVRAYLDDSTEPKITKVAEQELIAKQVSRHCDIVTFVRLTPVHVVVVWAVGF